MAKRTRKAIDWLEAAPENNLCRCGHHKAKHRDGYCEGTDVVDGEKIHCMCTYFSHEPLCKCGHTYEEHSLGIDDITLINPQCSKCVCYEWDPRDEH